MTYSFLANCCASPGTQTVTVFRHPRRRASLASVVCLLASCQSAERADRGDPSNVAFPHVSPTQPFANCIEDDREDVRRTDFDGGPDSGTPAFDLAIGATELVIPQSGSVELEIWIDRHPGFVEDVLVKIVGLPPGVEATEITLGHDTAGTVTVTAPSNVGIPWSDQARVRGYASTGTRSAPVSMQVRGAPGAIDLSFGVDGNAGLDSFYSVYDIEERFDGKLLVTGAENGSEIVMCRLSPSGELDLEFGSESGCVRLEERGFGQAINVAAEHVLLAASVDYGFLLARFGHDGSLDGAFGSGGVVRYAYPVPLFPTSLAVRGTQIMLAGASPGGVTFVARFDSTGNLDTSFGDGGIYSFGDSGFAELVPLDDCGVVVAAGNYVIAFDRDGIRDPDFGIDGVTTLPFRATAGFRTPAGELVVVGGDGSLEEGMILARISATGAVTDVSDAFEPPPEAEWVRARARHAQPSAAGSVIAGLVSNADGNALALARRLPSGEPDLTFGRQGITWTWVGNVASDVEVLNDGRIVVAGTRELSEGPILRFWD